LRLVLRLDPADGSSTQSSACSSTAFCILQCAPICLPGNISGQLKHGRVDVTTHRSSMPTTFAYIGSTA